MVYELFLAQTLATILGNTNFRYATTIGLYLASMGGGALLVERLKPGESFRRLFQVEVCISLLGIASPFAMLLVDYGVNELAFQFSQLGSEHLFWDTLRYAGTHFFIVSIGVLAGIELPLLMSIAAQWNKSHHILAIDYFGTVAGAIAFPLYLYPTFGIYELALIAGALNLISSFLVFPLKKAGVPSVYALIPVSLLTAVSIGLAHSRRWESAFLEKIYYGKAEEN